MNFAPTIGSTPFRPGGQSTGMSASLLADWLDKQDPNNPYSSVLRLTQPGGGSGYLSKMLGGALKPGATGGMGETSFADGLSGTVSSVPGASASIADIDLSGLLGESGAAGALGGAAGMASLF